MCSPRGDVRHRESAAPEEDPQQGAAAGRPSLRGLSAARGRRVLLRDPRPHPGYASLLGTDQKSRQGSVPANLAYWAIPNEGVVTRQEQNVDD